MVVAGGGVRGFTGAVFRCCWDVSEFRSVFDHFGGQNHQF